MNSSNEQWRAEGRSLYGVIDGCVVEVRVATLAGTEARGKTSEVLAAQLAERLNGSIQ